MLLRLQQNIMHFLTNAVRIEQIDINTLSRTILGTRDFLHITSSVLPGILFFYHIACTGGASINKWLLKNKAQNNVTYFTQ